MNRDGKDQLVHRISTNVIRYRIHVYTTPSVSTGKALTNASVLTTGQERTVSNLMITFITFKIAVFKALSISMSDKKTSQRNLFFYRLIQSLLMYLFLGQTDVLECSTLPCQHGAPCFEREGEPHFCQCPEGL